MFNQLEITARKQLLVHNMRIGTGGIDGTDGILGTDGTDGIDGIDNHTFDSRRKLS
jgi:hypothetical protein